MGAGQTIRQLPAKLRLSVQGNLQYLQIPGVHSRFAIFAIAYTSPVSAVFMPIFWSSRHFYSGAAGLQARRVGVKNTENHIYRYSPGRRFSAKAGLTPSSTHKSPPPMLSVVVQGYESPLKWAFITSYCFKMCNTGKGANDDRVFGQASFRCLHPPGTAIFAALKSILSLRVWGLFPSIEREHYGWLNRACPLQFCHCRVFRSCATFAFRSKKLPGKESGTFSSRGNRSLPSQHIIHATPCSPCCPRRD